MNCVGLLNETYAYGFQGQERDDEVSGSGNSYTAEFWQYDSRLGRRWNVDPVVKYHESPYASFANNPIWFVDPSGADTTHVGTESKAMINDMMNPKSDNYNKKFAKRLQGLVDDKDNVFNLNQWSGAKKVIEDGKVKYEYGEISASGKNAKGQNLIEIGFTIGKNSRDHELGALFEEVDHGAQFLEQRLAFFDFGDGYKPGASYDIYDEVDNKKFKVSAIQDFNNKSKYYTPRLYGLNAKIISGWSDSRIAKRLKTNGYNLTDGDMDVKAAVQYYINKGMKPKGFLYKR